MLLLKTNINDFQQLFERTSEASLITKDGVILACNNATIATTGFPDKTTILQARPEDISPKYQPDGRLSADKAPEMIALAQEKGIHRFDWQLLRFDGTPILLDITLMPIVLGGEEYIHALWLDHSQMVQQRQTKSMYQFIEKMGDAHLVLRNGRYIGCNQAAVDILGYPNKKTLLLNKLEKLYPDLQPDGKKSRVKALELSAIIREQGSYIFDWEYIKYDGSPIQVTTMVTVTTIDGEETFHIIWRDFSDFLRQQSALTESEQRYKALFKSSADAMFILEKDKFVDCNKAAIAMLGYDSIEEMMGRHPSALSPAIQADGRGSLEKADEIMQAISDQGSHRFEWISLRKNGQPIPVEILATAMIIGNRHLIHVVCRDITEKLKDQEIIRKLADEDDLTGLANKRILLKRLQHILTLYKRNHLQGALLFIDLDRFKDINDTLGHSAGDELLQQVSTRLTATVREGDTVSRFGGDEFVIMLENLAEESTPAATRAEIVCEKLLADLNQPYLLKDREITISASIGVAMFNEGSLVKRLLQQADIAMYQAKASGRNTIRFFDPIMQKNIDERSNMEQLIISSLANNRFELHYQLQVNQNNKAYGVEALLRLKHPVKGYLPPMQYIPLAEETGLIIPLGKWVLETACQQLARWEKQPTTACLTMAVNVSALEFKEEAFVQNVLDLVDKYKVNPRRLKLELTETLMVDSISDVIQKMNLLKDTGIQFSMDDFGTGYSSLQYLRKLPLYQLKIDQSFIRDLENDKQDSSIVQTIIAMGKGLGLNVIAEGVETNQQKSMLTDYGCSNFQGFLIAEPLTIDEINRLLGI